MIIVVIAETKKRGKVMDVNNDRIIGMLGEILGKLQKMEDVQLKVIESARLSISFKNSEESVKKVLDVVRDSGASGISRNELTRKTQYFRGSHERNDAILALVGRGVITESIKKLAGKQKPSTFFVYNEQVQS